VTTQDKLNIAGIGLTCLGSTVATVGVYFQMNGYFAVKPLDILVQIVALVGRFVSKGPTGVRGQLSIDAGLGHAKGEKHGITLFGFYCVLLGFLLQMLGSAFLILALFVNGGSSSGCPPG